MAEYIEKICHRHGKTKFRREQAGNLRWRCVQCSSLYTQRKRQKNKARLIKELGGKCIRCGYSKCQAALQLHHRDATKKEIGIGLRLISLSFATLKREAKKCDLLCANCHFEEHWRQDAE
jgi:hypothetical protein